MLLKSTAKVHKNLIQMFSFCYFFYFLFLNIFSCSLFDLFPTTDIIQNTITDAKSKAQMMLKIIDSVSIILII